MVRKKTILAVLDDRAGNNTQVLGIALRLAKKINAEVITKTAEYNSFVKFPFLKFFGKLLHVKNINDFNTQVDIIITAGRRASFIGHMHKKKHKSKWICTMWPGYIGKNADVLVLPMHDKKRNYKNVIEFLGSPNNLNLDSIANEAKNFVEYSNITKKKIACLIGGSHKSGVLDEEIAQDISIKINILCEQEGLYPLVTVSRRTGDKNTAILENTINEPKVFYKLEGPNPYKAFLYYCDVILVTSDSIAMVSEAIATGKPVIVYDHEKLSGKKHKSFIKDLQNHSYISLLGENFSYHKSPNLMAELIENIHNKLS